MEIERHQNEIEGKNSKRNRIEIEDERRVKTNAISRLRASIRDEPIDRRIQKESFHQNRK